MGGETVDTVRTQGEQVTGSVVYIETETTTPTRVDNASIPSLSISLYIVLCLLKVVKRESMMMNHYIDLYIFTCWVG